MKTPLQIGVTGGIGSGKSIVCKIFQCLEVAVYDADSRAKSLMTSDGILVSAIRQEFGSLAYHSDGSINRKFLADVVFKDSTSLKKLNALVHPAVGIDYRKWLADQTGPYVIREAALLYEANSYQDLDKIIVVYAPEELRVKRVLERDPLRSKEQIIEIINSQLSDEEKRKRADFVVWNDESRLVVPQVLELHHRFLMLE